MVSSSFDQISSFFTRHWGAYKYRERGVNHARLEKQLDKIESHLSRSNNPLSALTAAFLRNLTKYGSLTALVISIVPECGSVMNRVDQHLIGREFEQVKVFKRSFTESFTMIGVAGAIIAQIAFTGLSMDRLGDTHWTAYAAFVVSLVAGCLSVFFSCKMQLLLSGLHSPREIMRWLTKPRLKQEIERRQKGRAVVVKHGDGRGAYEWEVRRVPCLSAALMLVAPSQLLSLSLGAFLVGLGIYIGFLYAHHLTAFTDKHADLAILIVYIVATALFLAMLGIPSGTKALETFRTREQMEGLEMLEFTQEDERRLRMPSSSRGEDDKDVSPGPSRIREI